MNTELPLPRANHPFRALEPLIGSPESAFTGQQEPNDKPETDSPLRDTPQVIVGALERAACEIRYHQRRDHESRIRFVTLRDLLLEIARGRSSDGCNMGASLVDGLSVVDTLEDILRAIRREQSVPVPPPQSPEEQA